MAKASLSISLWGRENVVVWIFGEKFSLAKNRDRHPSLSPLHLPTALSHSVCVQICV